MKEYGATLNVAFLATPVSKGCAPTAHAHCFQAAACWKAIKNLKVSVNNVCFLKYISNAQMSFSFACIKCANG